MRKMFRGAAALATAATAVVALSGVAQAKPADDAWDGCPYGAVCIYSQGVDPQNDPHPTNVYYSYGAHNLSNQLGYHWVYNNQYGGASMSLCSGYNGTGCGSPIGEGVGVYANLTPVNSITLNRP